MWVRIALPDPGKEKKHVRRRRREPDQGLLFLDTLPQKNPPPSPFDDATRIRTLVKGERDPSHCLLTGPKGISLCRTRCYTMQVGKERPFLCCWASAVTGVIVPKEDGCIVGRSLLRASSRGIYELNSEHRPSAFAKARMTKHI